MKRKQGSGFTLVELLVAAGLTALLVILTGWVLRGAGEQSQLSNVVMTLQESARESVYQINMNLREAAGSRTVITNQGSTVSYQFPSSISNSGVVTWSSPVNLQIGGNGTQLVLFDTGSRQTTVLANDVQGLNFTGTGNPLETINFTVTAQRTMTNNRVLQAGASGEVKLRNG